MSAGGGSLQTAANHGFVSSVGNTAEAQWADSRKELQIHTHQSANWGVGGASASWLIP